MTAYYRIFVKGQIALHWSEWLGGMQIKRLEDDQTCLQGEISDQAALHGLLNKIRDLNLVLIRVERLDDRSPGSV